MISRRSLVGAAVAMMAVPMQALAARMEVLGQATVRLRDRGVSIDIGKRQGQFNGIRIAVSGAPIYIDSIRVTLGSGKKVGVNVRDRLRDGEATGMIGLPGDDPRGVKRVEISYSAVEERGNGNRNDYRYNDRRYDNNLYNERNRVARLTIYGRAR